MKFIYLFIVFASLLELVIYYETIHVKVNKNYVLLFISSFASNYGYAMSCFSETNEAFLCGYQVFFIGSIFVLYFTVTILNELCNKNYNTYLRLFMFIYSVVLCYFVASIMYSDILFKNAKVIKYMNMSVLEKEPGKLYFMYVLYILTMLVTALYSISSSYKTKKVSRKTLISVLLITFLGILAYTLPKMFSFNIELLPFYFTIMELIFLQIVKRIELYDMSSNLLKVYNERNEYGYIAFDINKRFMGCNDFAAKIFPELFAISIDSLIPKEYDFLQTHLIKPIEEWNENSNIEYNVNEGTFTASFTIRYIKNNNKNIGYLIELKDSTAQQTYINNLDNYNHQLKSEVEKKTNKILEIEDSIITGMATMVESRDNSTGGHIHRTSDCVKIFISELKKHKEFKWLTPEFCKYIIKAAPMHDLGKIAVNDAVLQKPGKFTPEEYKEMQKHPEEGVRIVENVLSEIDDLYFKQLAKNIAHYHHEKWDGTGYPSHIKQYDIPVEARIMSLVDVFDALVSKRCYKDAFSFDDAFAIIQDNLGTQFDPEIGKVFISCRSKLEDYYKRHA